MQGTMPGARRRGRPRTAWMDKIKTGLPVEESVRMTEDRDKWRKYVHGVANPRIEKNKQKIMVDRRVINYVRPATSYRRGQQARPSTSYVDNTKNSPWQVD